MPKNRTITIVGQHMGCTVYDGDRLVSKCEKHCCPGGLLKALGLEVEYWDEPYDREFWEKRQWLWFDSLKEFRLAWTKFARKKKEDRLRCAKEEVARLTKELSK